MDQRDAASPAPQSHCPADPCADPEDMIAPEDRGKRKESPVGDGPANTTDSKRSQSASTLHCPKSVCCGPIARSSKSQKSSRACSKEGGCLSLVFSGDGRQKPEVLTTNASGSFSSMKRERAESSRSLLDSQMSRIMEELSQAASVSKKSTSQGSPMSERSARHSQGSIQTAMMTNEPLYVFSPRHHQSACFMYRAKDGGSNGDAYEFDHVQVRTVQWYGSPAYLMVMSDKEEATTSLQGASKSRSSSLQAICSRAKSTADTQSSGRQTNRTLSGGRPSVYPKCSPQLISGAIAEVAIDKVQERLKTTTQHRHVLRSDRGGSPGPDETLYLVSDRDISDSLRLAFAELEHTEFAGAKRSLSSGDCRLRTDTLLFPRPDSRCGVASTPGVGDVATTAGIFKASFASINRGGSHCVHRISDPARVASGPSANGIPSCQSDTRKPKTTTKFKLGCHDFLCSTRDTTDELPTKCVVDKERAGSPSRNMVSPDTEISPADTDTNMTSFPELPPRHCTNEWLRPPIDLDHLNGQHPPDFYRMGVDAHSGGGAPSRQLDGTDAEPPTWTLRCDFSLFDKDPFHGDEAFLSGQYGKTKRSSWTATAAAADKRLGGSIGSASHRRRSSHAPDGDAWQADQVDGLVPTLIDRLRGGGLRMLHRHECLSPAKVVDGASASKARLKSRVGRRRLPSPPKKSLALPLKVKANGSPVIGIGEEVKSARQARRGTCSEDNLPHVCENDLDSDPAVDEVGL